MKLVSIVLPVYNGEKFLAQSIESVIAQTYKDWELIIVNDCSTDGTAEIIQKYASKDKRIKVITNKKNQKLPGSLNIGFAQAKGEYLTWTSDDNIYKPNALEYMVEYLNNHKDVDLISCDCDLISENGKTIGKISDNYDMRDVLDLCAKNNVGACFMYTEKMAKKVGEYDIDTFCAEDYDYWCRVALEGKIYYDRKNLYKYRVHGASLTATKSNEATKKSVDIQNKYAFKLMQKYVLRPKTQTKKFLEFYNLTNNKHFLEMARACDSSTYIKLRLKGILKNIISVKDKNNRKIITILGIKISYKKTHDYFTEYLKTKQQLDYMKEHCDIFHLKPATGELREQQLGLVQFALDFFDKIKSLDCKPILFAGNMLGAVRHQGFIPWDDDLDFLLIRSDYEKIIKWCEQNGIVCFYHHRLSEYNSYEIGHRLYKNVTQHPNQYVLDVWFNLLQLSYGTNLDDLKFIDFFALDYYKEDYTFQEHRKYTQNILSKIKQIDWLDEASKFVRAEREKNPNIVAKSNKLFYGIDSVEIKPWNTDFLPESSLYPLKKVPFENAEFYIPNQAEKWLDLNFKDWKSFPDDIGFSHHNYAKELFKKKNENI